MRAAFDRRRHAHPPAAQRHRRRQLHASPQGAFYAFPSFEGVLGRELAGQTPTTTLELADLILDEAKVAFVPGEAFGSPGYGRFSFALDDDDLQEGIRRIAEFLA